MARDISSYVEGWRQKILRDRRANEERRQQALADAQKIARFLAENHGVLNWLYAEWQGVDVESGAHSLLMRGKASVFHDFYCGAERIFLTSGRLIPVFFQIPPRP